jgi:hypothetical protein
VFAGLTLTDAVSEMLNSGDALPIAANDEDIVRQCTDLEMRTVIAFSGSRFAFRLLQWSGDRSTMMP